MVYIQSEVNCHLVKKTEMEKIQIVTWDILIALVFEKVVKERNSKGRISNV